MAGPRLGKPRRTHRFLQARCNNEASMWWRRMTPLRGSRESFEAGKTYFQVHSRFAFGYLRSKA